jgi:hypothetical protein
MNSDICYMCNEYEWADSRDDSYQFNISYIETVHKLVSRVFLDGSSRKLSDMILLVRSYQTMVDHITQVIRERHSRCTAERTDAEYDIDAVAYYYTGLSVQQLWCLSRLGDCISEMEAIEAMVGMESIKETFVRLMKFLANLKPGQLERDSFLMHMVISGPPGHGKTEIAQLLGRAFMKSGLLTSDKFIKADRSRLIGAYCGHTAKATRATFEEARGGVIFIDEVYSLGNSEKRDAFTKECIDTINQMLSEMPDTLCIIAGYEAEIESCFFSYNPGLSRRFPWRFKIAQYNATDLVHIFYKKVGDIGREADAGALMASDIADNMQRFKHAGGDIANLVTQCVLAHYENSFMCDSSSSTLSRKDVQMGLQLYIANYKVEPVEEERPPPFGMYT